MVPVHKEVKKPEQAITEAEQALQALVPTAVPSPVAVAPEQEKLAREMEKAYEAVADLGTYAEELAQNLPVDVNYEAEKMLASLEKSKMKEIEVMGEQRYKDETADIEKTIKAAQKAEKAGMHDDAVELIKAAKVKTDLLGNIIALQRGLAVAGAPAEVIDGVEKSYEFYTKGETERGDLLIKSANLYMGFPQVFKSKKEFSDNLVLFVSQVSSGKKIDIKKSGEYFEYLAGETIKTADRNALEAAVTSESLTGDLKIVYENSTGELKKQTGELLKKLEDVNKRLSDEKTMGTVSDEELESLYTAATIATDAFDTISDVEKKQTQKNLGAIYGNAVNAAMNGKTDEAYLHSLMAQEYLVKSDDEKYRAGILSTSGQLAEGKTTYEKVFKQFYLTLSNEAGKLAEKDKELGKFISKMKPAKELKPEEMDMNSLFVLRSAIHLSSSVSEEIDVIGEEHRKTGDRFLANGYASLAKGDITSAAYQIELFRSYALASTDEERKGIESLSNILKKEPKKGLELADQFLFLETEAGLLKAAQNDAGQGTRENDIVGRSLLWIQEMQAKVMAGEVLSKEDEVTASLLEKTTLTMMEVVVQLKNQGLVQENAIELFDRSLVLIMEGYPEAGITYARGAMIMGSLDKKDQQNLANILMSDQTTAETAALAVQIYESKVNNLEKLDAKINYYEGLKSDKKRDELKTKIEKIEKEKENLEKIPEKTLKEKKKIEELTKKIEEEKKKLEQLNEKIKKSESYLKSLKQIRAKVANNYDLAAEFFLKADYNSASYVSDAASVYAEVKLLPSKAKKTKEAEAALAFANGVLKAGKDALEKNKAVADVLKKKPETLQKESFSAWQDIEAASFSADYEGIKSMATKARYKSEDADYEYVMSMADSASEMYAKGRGNLEKSMELAAQGKKEEAAELAKLGQSQVDYAQKLMLAVKEYNFSVMRINTKKKTAGREDLLGAMKIYHALGNGVLIKPNGEPALDANGKIIPLDKKTVLAYEKQAEELLGDGYVAVGQQKNLNKTKKKMEKLYSEKEKELVAQMKHVNESQPKLGEVIDPDEQTNIDDANYAVRDSIAKLKKAKKQMEAGNYKAAFKTLDTAGIFLAGAESLLNFNASGKKAKEYGGMIYAAKGKEAEQAVDGFGQYLPKPPPAVADFTAPGLTAFDYGKYSAGINIGLTYAKQGKNDEARGKITSVNNEMNKDFEKQKMVYNGGANKKASQYFAWVSENAPNMAQVPPPMYLESEKETENREENNDKVFGKTNIDETAGVMYAGLAEKYDTAAILWDMAAAGGINKDMANDFETTEIAPVLQSATTVAKAASMELDGAFENYGTAQDAGLLSKTVAAFKGLGTLELEAAAEKRISLSTTLLENWQDIDAYMAEHGADYAAELNDVRTDEYKALNAFTLDKKKLKGKAGELGQADATLALAGMGYSVDWESGAVEKHVFDMSNEEDVKKLAAIQESYGKFLSMRSTVIGTVVGPGGVWSGLFTKKSQGALIDLTITAALSYAGAGEAALKGDMEKSDKLMAKGDDITVKKKVYGLSAGDVFWAAGEAYGAGVLGTMLIPGVGWMVAGYYGFEKYEDLKKMAKGKEMTELQYYQSKVMASESHARMARMGTMMVTTSALFAASVPTGGTSTLLATALMAAESTAGLGETYQMSGGWKYMNPWEKGLFMFDIGMTAAMFAVPVGGLIVEEMAMGSLALQTAAKAPAALPKGLQAAMKGMGYAGYGLLAMGTARAVMDAPSIIDAISSGEMTGLEAAFIVMNQVLPAAQAGLYARRVGKPPSMQYRSKVAQYIEAFTLGTPFDDATMHFMSAEAYNASKAKKAPPPMKEMPKPAEIIETAPSVPKEAEVIPFPKKKITVPPAEEVAIPVTVEYGSDLLTNKFDKKVFDNYSAELAKSGLEMTPELESTIIGGYLEQKKDNPDLLFSKYMRDAGWIEKKAPNLGKLQKEGFIGGEMAKEAVAGIVAEKPGAPAAKKAPAPAVEMGEGKVVGFAPEAKPAEAPVKKIPEPKDFIPSKLVLWKGELSADNVAGYVADYVLRLIDKSQLGFELRDQNSGLRKILKNLGELAAKYPEFGDKLLDNIVASIESKAKFMPPEYIDLLVKGTEATTGAAEIFKAEKAKVKFDSDRLSKLETSFEKIKSDLAKGKVDQDAIADYIFEAMYVGEHKEVVKSDNVYMDNLYSELAKYDIPSKDLDGALSIVQKKLQSKVDIAEMNLPEKWKQDYFDKNMNLSMAKSAVRDLPITFKRNLNDEKVAYQLYKKKDIPGKSAEAVVFEGVKGYTHDFLDGLMYLGVLDSESHSVILSTLLAEGKTKLLDAMVNPTVKKAFKKALKAVREAVALMENKLLVDELVDEQIKQAVTEQGQNKIAGIEHPLGKKVVLVNMDKAFTWLMNAMGNVRSEDGLAGSALGDAALFIYFKAIKELGKQDGIMPTKLTKQGDEGLTVFTGDDAHAKAEAYVDALGKKMKDIAVILGISDSAFKDVLVKFSAEVISVEATYTYDPKTETFGMKFHRPDKKGEKPISLNALLSKVEGESTIGKLESKAAELRKLNMHDQAEKLEVHIEKLKKYLDDVVSKLDKLEAPKVKGADALKAEEMITETVLARVDVEKELYGALHAMAETNGKGVGHVEEHNVGPSVLNQLGHPVTDYFSALWQKALFESLNEAGIYGAFTEGKVEIYAQGPMAVGLRYDESVPGLKAKVNDVKKAAAAKFKGYAEAKDAGVADISIYTGANKDLASLEIAKKVAGFDISAEEYVDMKSITAALWLNPEEFLEGKFAKATPKNKKYKSALANMKKAKWVRTPEDMITYLHTIGIKKPEEMKAIFTELGVEWGKKAPTPTIPPPAAPVAEKEVSAAELKALAKGKGFMAAEITTDDALKSAIHGMETDSGLPVIVPVEKGDLVKAMKNQPELFMPIVDEETGKAKVIASYKSDSGKQVEVMATKPFLDKEGRMFSYAYFKVEGEATYIVPIYESNSSVVWRAAPLREPKGLGGHLEKGAVDSDNGFLIPMSVSKEFYEIFSKYTPEKLETSAPIANALDVKGESYENYSKLFKEAETVKKVADEAKPNYTEADVMGLPESELYGKDAVMVSVPAEDGSWIYHFVVYKEEGKMKYFLGAAEPAGGATDTGIIAKKLTLHSDVSVPGYEYAIVKKKATGMFAEGGMKKGKYAEVDQAFIKAKLEKAGIKIDENALFGLYDDAMGVPKPKIKEVVPEGPPVIKTKIKIVGEAPESAKPMAEAPKAEMAADIEAAAKIPVKKAVKIPPTESEVMKIVKDKELLADAENGKYHDLAELYVKKSEEERAVILEYCKTFETKEASVALHDLEILAKYGDEIGEIYAAPGKKPIDKKELIKIYLDETSPIKARFSVLGSGLGMDVLIVREGGRLSPEKLAAVTVNKAIFDLLPLSKEKFGGKITSVKRTATGRTGAYLITVEGEKATSHFFMKLGDHKAENLGIEVSTLSGDIVPQMAHVKEDYAVAPDITTTEGKTDRAGRTVEYKVVDGSDVEMAKVLEAYAKENPDAAKSLYGENFAPAAVSGLLDKHSNNVWFLKLEITNPHEVKDGVALIDHLQNKGYTVIEENGKYYTYSFGGIDLDSAGYFPVALTADGKPKIELELWAFAASSIVEKFFQIETGLKKPEVGDPGRKKYYNILADYSKKFFAEDGPFMEGFKKWMGEHVDNAEYKEAMIAVFAEYEGNVGTSTNLTKNDKAAVKEQKPLLKDAYKMGEEGNFIPDMEGRYEFIPKGEKIKTAFEMTIEPGTPLEALGEKIDQLSLPRTGYLVPEGVVSASAKSALSEMGGIYHFTYGGEEMIFISTDTITKVQFKAELKAELDSIPKLRIEKKGDVIKTYDSNTEHLMPKEDVTYYLVPVEALETVDASKVLSIGFIKSKNFQVFEKPPEGVPSMKAKWVGSKDNIIVYGTEEKMASPEFGIESTDTGAIPCFEALMNLSEEEWASNMTQVGNLMSKYYSVVAAKL